MYYIIEQPIGINSVGLSSPTHLLLASQVCMPVLDCRQHFDCSGAMCLTRDKPLLVHSQHSLVTNDVNVVNNVINIG